MNVQNFVSVSKENNMDIPQAYTSIRRNSFRYFLFPMCIPTSLINKGRSGMVTIVRDRPIFRTVFKILTPLGFRWVGGTDLFRHGNPNLVRILKTVRIIGRSLTGR